MVNNETNSRKTCLEFRTIEDSDDVCVDFYKKLKGNYIVYRHSITDHPKITIDYLSIDSFDHDKNVMNVRYGGNVAHYDGVSFKVKGTSTFYFLFEGIENSVWSNTQLIVFFMQYKPLFSTEQIHEKYLFGINLNINSKNGSCPAATSVIFERREGIESLDELIKSDVSYANNEWFKSKKPHIYNFFMAAYNGKKNIIEVPERIIKRFFKDIEL